MATSWCWFRTHGQMKLSEMVIGRTQHQERASNCPTLGAVEAGVDQRED